MDDTNMNKDMDENTTCEKTVEVCSTCGQTMRSRSGACDHRRRHTNTAPYMCCGKLFYSQANKKRHRCSVHGEAKVFRCSRCEFSGATQSDIRRHEKVHEIPAFKCLMCGKAFRRSLALKEHMDTHQRIKTYVCKCGKSFRYSSGISRHRKACKGKN